MRSAHPRTGGAEPWSPPECVLAPRARKATLSCWSVCHYQTLTRKTLANDNAPRIARFLRNLMYVRIFFEQNSHG